jgi:hypothetical protein
MSYERVRGLTIEEEKRLQEYKHDLQSTVEKLYDLECTMSAVNKDMFEERRRVVEEINLLGHTKQNVQSQLFAIAETQKRLQKEGLNAGSVIGSHNNSSLRVPNVPVLLGGMTLTAPSGLNQLQSKTIVKTSVDSSSMTKANNVAAVNDADGNPMNQLQNEIAKLKQQSAAVLNNRQ